MECGPVNPLASLKNQLDADVYKDKFRAGSRILREAPSQEVLQQQQFAEAFIQNEASLPLTQNILSVNAPRFDERFGFKDMHEALNEDRFLAKPDLLGPHTQSTTAPETLWQNEFQAFQPSASKLVFEKDSQSYRQFEEIFQQSSTQALISDSSRQSETLKSQEQGTSWAESFHAFRHTTAVTLTEEENASLDEAFKQARSRLHGEEESAFDANRFQAEHWVKEFHAEHSALAEAAGEVLDALDQQQHPNFSSSEFAKFMQKLRDEELKIEGGQLIDQTSWAEDFQKTVDAFSTDDAFLQQGLERDWAESFDLKTTGWEDAMEAPYTWDATLPEYMEYRMDTENPFLRLSKAELESKTDENLSLSESILVLEAKLMHTPQDATLWYQLGVKQQENEKEQQAISALRQALQQNPQQLNAWLALAVSYTNENRSECASDALRCWLQHHPQYRAIPGSAQTTPTPSALTEVYLRAVQSSPNVDPDLQVALGVLFNLTEEYDRAVDCFNVALACRPYDAFLWNKLGATLANSNQSEKAVDAYFRALQINPNYIRARYNLGIACIHLKQHREALQQFTQALLLQQQYQSNGSTHIWESLKMACLLMQRSDLAHFCDQRDLRSLQAVVGML